MTDELLLLGWRHPSAKWMGGRRKFHIENIDAKAIEGASVVTICGRCWGEPDFLKLESEVELDQRCGACYRWFRPASSSSKSSDPSEDTD